MCNCNGNDKNCKCNIDLTLDRVARILYNMSLDMDYADYLETSEEEISALETELRMLVELKCDSLIQALEVIAGQNEDMEYWKDNQIMK